MKNNLFNKFYFSTVILFILGILLLVLSLSVVLSNYFANEKKTLLVDNCLRISSVANSDDDNTFYAEGRDLAMVSALAHSIDSEIYITDANGRVVLCSCHEWRQMDRCMHSSQAVSEQILQSVSKAENNFFEIGNLNGRYPDLYYTAATVITEKNSDVAVGYVFASSSAESLQEMLNSLSKMLLFSSVLPIILLAASVYVTTSRVTKPLKLMSNAAHSMASGDFSKRIPVKGNDEIAELAKSFNLMTNSFVQLESMQRSFITNVSHELRTPITTIAGFIDGILDGTVPKDKQNDYLKIVSKEAKRLTGVVQSMLSLAKLESGEMSVNLENCNMIEIVGSTLISQVKRIEDKNIEIVGLDEVESFDVNVDKDLMQQVIYNLVDNAIKFTPDNGKIEFRFFKENNSSHITIRNYGLGISSEEMQHVFEKFYKNDKVRSQNREGVGIGLYIVKTVMDIHKGSVTVSSSEDEYTEFELILPDTINPQLGGNNGQ